MKSLLGIVFCLTLNATQMSVAQDNQHQADKILSYVPKNVEQFLVVRPAQIFKSADMAKFRRAAGNKLDRYFDRLLNNYLKFGLADLEEIDALVNADWTISSDDDQSWSSHSVLILRTVEENSDRFDLATHAVESETEFKDKTIFKMKTRLNGRYGFSCILDDKTIVWSSRKDSIEQVVSAGEAGPDKANFFKSWAPFAKRDISYLFSANERRLTYAPAPFDAFKDIEFLVGGANLGEESVVHAVALCKSKEKAGTIHELATSQKKLAEMALDRQAKTDPAEKEMIQVAKNLLKSAKFIKRNQQVIASARLKLDFDKLAEPLMQVYAAQKRTEAANNIRQQALAIHNFESAHGSLPKSVMIHESGKKYSWRIAILPFVERMDIYERYDFTQEWDSPHNLEVTSEMPDFFRSDLDDTETTNTSFFLLTGEGGSAGNEGPLNFADFLDGTSNTIMAIEAKRDIHWAKPEDIEIPMDGDLPEFGGFHEGGFNIVRWDGSVTFLPENVAGNYLREMFTPAGGEVSPRSIPLESDQEADK